MTCQARNSFRAVMPPGRQTGRELRITGGGVGLERNPRVLSSVDGDGSAVSLTFAPAAVSDSVVQEPRRQQFPDIAGRGVLRRDRVNQAVSGVYIHISVVRYSCCCVLHYDTDV